MKKLTPRPGDLAVDTETRGLEWFDPDHRAFLVSWSTTEGDWECPAQGDEDGIDAFKDALHYCTRIVLFNAPFDFLHLLGIGIDLRSYGKPIIDANILARVVTPERRGKADNEEEDEAVKSKYGFRLKDMAVTFVDPGAKDSEDELKKLAEKHKIKLKETHGYYKLWLVEPEAMEHYAREDTRLTLQLLPHLEELVGERFARVWALENGVQQHLINATHRGVMVDKFKVIALDNKYRVLRSQAYAKLVAAFGEGIFEPPDGWPEATEFEGEDGWPTSESPDVLRDALLKYGVPLTRMTKSGKSLSTNKFALQDHEDEFPILKTLAEYRQAKKFLSTYTGAMLGREIVHATFWQIGARTGRMSCSRPNMQNIPVRGEGAAELRSMFVPRPGYCFVVSDFDQIELRLLAYYLNSQEFTEKIERGEDVFAELAAHLAHQLGYADEFGTDPANYYKGKPGAVKRGDAKNVVYAISYGAGRGRVTDMLGLDPEGLVEVPFRGGIEVRGGRYQEGDYMVNKGWANVGEPCHEPGYAVVKLVRGWLPNYFALTSRIKHKVKGVGHVNTLMGRKQPVNADKDYVGLNAIIQGGAADAFKLAITAAAEAVLPFGALPVLFVHDEIVTECPIEHAEACLAAQDAAMASVINIRPALAVSGSIAYNDYSEGK